MEGEAVEDSIGLIGEVVFLFDSRVEVVSLLIDGVGNPLPKLNSQLKLVKFPTMLLLVFYSLLLLVIIMRMTMIMMTKMTMVIMMMTSIMMTMMLRITMTMMLIKKTSWQLQDSVAP